MFVCNQVNGARAWLPCVETLTDRCTWTMELTCDANFLVIASGELLEQVRCRTADACGKKTHGHRVLCIEARHRGQTGTFYTTSLRPLRRSFGDTQA